MMDDKAIASAAISGRGDPHIESVVVAGMMVGVAILIMSLSGMLHYSARAIPVPVVKGIQHGAGLSLIISAGSSLLMKLGWVDPAYDNLLWALAAFMVLICTQTLARFPYALYVFVVGIVLSSVFIATSGDDSHGFPWFTIWAPKVIPLDGVPRHWKSSLYMAIGQLPLTTLNSIIAVTALSADILPGMAAPSVTALGISVALMNLTGTWLGTMPLCHGSGGLAAQYRFGARSGASIVILGLFKMILGLFFGDSLIDLLAHFPKGVLGIMVLAAGLELAKVGHAVNRGAADLWDDYIASDSNLRKHKNLTEEELNERRTVMLITTAGILAFKNDAIGFAAGMLCTWAFSLSRRVADWRKPGGRLSETAPLLS
jgi:MFS superfamily sulfate permease-like transporter